MSFPCQVWWTSFKSLERYCINKLRMEHEQPKNILPLATMYGGRRHKKKFKCILGTTYILCHKIMFSPFCIWYQLHLCITPNLSPYWLQSVTIGFWKILQHFWFHDVIKNWPSFLDDAPQPFIMWMLNKLPIWQQPPTWHCLHNHHHRHIVSDDNAMTFVVTPPFLRYSGRTLMPPWNAGIAGFQNDQTGC